MSNWLNKLISKKKTQQNAALGVSITPRGASWCVLEKHGGRTVMSQIAVVEGQFRTPLEGLQSLQREHPLPALPCHISLSHHYYNMLLVDAPDVPTGELREAVKWRLKDLITQPIEQMVVDVFQLPDDAYRGRMNMLYAAVMEKKQVSALIEACEAMPLQLQEIGIAELALAAVAQHMPDLENLGLALLFLTGEDGSINLVENGYLYLTRNLEMNGVGSYSNTIEFNQDPTDNLALDIQRSLDYYESQLGKSGVNRLYLITESVEQQEWCDGLSQRLPVRAMPFDLSACVEHGADLSILQQGLLAPAVGIAMGAARAAT